MRSISLRHVPALLFLLAPIIFLTIVSEANALVPPLIQDTGNGANGDDGIDGDPGTHGSDGEAGKDISFDSPNTRAFVRATSGGNGGNGGNGVDANDDGSAMGGNAGHGGIGGNAESFASGVVNPGTDDQFLVFASSQARGGDGGSGGFFGWGTSSELHGSGSRGADGGNATATFLGGFGGNAKAYGGNGGNAYGASGVAGNGGEAFASGSTVNRRISDEDSPDSGFYYSSFSLTQRGGVGGVGYVGAQAGNGASVSFGASGQFEIQDGEFVNTTDVRVEGYAGSGGDTENGIAGAAGDATYDMVNVFSQLRGTASVNTYSNSVLYGGHGGRGFASGTQSVSGADGGDARVVTGDGQIDTVGSHWQRFELRGGNGGAAKGRLNQGDGGQGGEAVLGALHFDTSNSTNLYDGFQFYVRMVGGNGGHAQGSGWSGHGASASLGGDDFSAAINGSFSSQIEIHGGSGGWGKRSGNGGDATLEQIDDYTIVGSDPAVRGTSQIAAYVTGGDAGRGLAGERSADGGNATATLVQSHDVDNVDLRITARAGSGNLGRSGNATAIANGHSMNPNEDGFAFTSTRAEGADFFEVIRSSHGSNSLAESTANSAGRSTANAAAIGGWGFLESGQASSMATAISTGENEIARANASSFAYGDRETESDNSSTSHAIAIASRSDARAVSSAAMAGHYNTATATSESLGVRGRSEAHTRSSTTTWEHQAALSSESLWDNDDGTATSIDTVTSFGFRDDVALADVSAMESYVVSQVIPDQVVADTFLESASAEINELFGNEEAYVLGIGQIGGGFAGDEINGTLNIASNYDLELRLQEDHDEGNMMLGFFADRASGDGFTEMSFGLNYNGRQIIDETFTALSDAESFFDNSLINLGELNGLQELVDFDFDFSMTIDNPMDAFGFSFAFGNADPNSSPQAFFASANNFQGSFSSVPEPSSFVVGVFGLLGLLKRRRQV